MKTTFAVLALCVGVLGVIAGAPIVPVHCIGCGKPLYRETPIARLICPPSTCNPVCWPCLVGTALLEGDNPSVNPVREWVEKQRPTHP